MTIPLVIVTAQESSDYQWLIMEGDGKDGIVNLLNDFSNVDVGNNIIVFGATYPNQDVLTSPIDINREYSNDFFAILSDGSCSFFRHNNDGAAYIPPNHDNIYQLVAPLSFEYLYLTNTYEEDDPPSSISVTGGGGVNFPDPDMTTNPLSGILNINHDPVKGKDLTVIIEGRQNKDCTLGFQILDSDGTEEFGDFSLVASNFTDNSNLLHGSIPQGDIVHFNNTHQAEFTTGSGDYTYLNFKVEYEDPNIVGNVFNMFLDCGVGAPVPLRTAEGENYLVSGGPHDPNGFELQCVWEEEIRCKWLPFIKKKKKMARYRVHCYNESMVGPVAQLEYSFILPDEAKPGTFSITSNQIRGAMRPCDIGEIDYSEWPKVKYRFGDGLTTFPTGVSHITHTGSLSFCVELKSNTDLTTADLTIIDPISIFDNIPYPIRFYDLNRSCKSRCIRTLEKCDCSCSMGPVESDTGSGIR